MACVVLILLTIKKQRVKSASGAKKIKREIRKHTESCKVCAEDKKIQQ